MNYCFCILLLLFSSLSVGTYAQNPDVLAALDEELEVKEVYVAHKLERLSSLKEKLRSGDHTSQTRYDLLSQIFREYRSFNFDSSFTYVRKLEALSYQLGDEDKIVATKMKWGFIFLSSGMYKEGLDSLHTIRAEALAPDQRAEYYSLLARVYYGMADFNTHAFFTEAYNRSGNAYIDSVLRYSQPQEFDHLYFRGLRNARMLNVREGLQDLETLNQRQDLSYHQAAVVASTLSDIYIRMGDTERALELLSKAAILDIKASIKETAAILIIADILRSRGEISKAYAYTRQALDDANFYNARHRKINVGTILPIIEEEKSLIVDRQNRRLMTYAIAVTVLTLAVILFVVIIIRQLRKLKGAEKRIVHANLVLQDTNQMLLESNKIKEEYIGYYFNINSEYLDKIEKFKKSVESNLRAKKYDHLQWVINNIDLKKERDELYQGFDKVFLKLFPTFIPKYNALFKKEDQVQLHDNQLMNSDLRIFALIRIGITDNDKIAKILGYSVNTIYAYKTRIKNKALVPNEEFEKRILEIEPI